MFMNTLYKYVEMLTCSNLNECAAFSAIVSFVSVVIALRVKRQELIFMLMLHMFAHRGQMQSCTKINISKRKDCYLIS